MLKNWLRMFKKIYFIRDFFWFTTGVKGKVGENHEKKFSQCSQESWSYTEAVGINFRS